MRTSPEEYMRRLEEIQRGSSTKYIMVPEDEPRFVVNTNTREIKIPEEFTFLGALMDHGAETIYFELDRYFDDHDLSEETCVVQYISVDENGKEQAYGVYPVELIDVSSVEGKIIVGWTVENEVTQRKGNVAFSIRFYSITMIEDQYGESVPVFSYCFNTLTASLPVLDTLNVTGSYYQKYPALFEEWSRKMYAVERNVSNSYVQIKEIVDGIPKELTSIVDELEKKYNHLGMTIYKDIDGYYIIDETQ